MRVPPLRERAEDLPSLILFALDAAARVLGRAAVGLEPAAQQRLLAHDWPGNLEELHAVIELAVARCSGPRITLAELPALGPKPAAAKESGHPLDGTLERVERRVLQRALERTTATRAKPRACSACRAPRSSTSYAAMSWMRARRVHRAAG